MLALFATIAILLLGLPLILADPQGPPFTCAPFPASDRRALAFESLSPFCCPEGLVDDELKIGRRCVLAQRVRDAVDLKGNRLESCGVGKVMSCCMIIVGFRPFIRQFCMGWWNRKELM